MNKTNLYQLTENILQLHNVTKLYTNTTTANLTRPVFNVFDKGKDSTATHNLPDTIKDSPCVNKFKLLIKEWKGENCKC